METFITIGEIIRHYRKEQGISQEALADGICHRKYISSIEQNKQIPTLDIINQLSDRLGINLYETYALMLQHVNIDTHKRIEELNKNFSLKGYSNLHTLIKEYERLPEFQHGEPFLALTQARALSLAWCEKNYTAAVEVILDALKQERIIVNDYPLTHKLSNNTLSLLNALAVNYCRSKNYTEGQRYFDFLMEYIEKYFSQNHYATNRNNQFELKFLTNITYNYFLFFRGNGKVDVAKIDDVLNLMKSLHTHHLLPELLLCKAYLLVESKDLNSALCLYNIAHNLGVYLYEEKYQRHLEETILSQHLPIFIISAPQQQN